MTTKKGFRTLCLNLHVLVEEDLSRKLFPEWDFQEDISRKRCPGVHVEENMFWKNYPDNSRNWFHRWDFQDDMSNEQEDMSWYKCPGRHVHNANLTIALPIVYHLLYTYSEEWYKLALLHVIEKSACFRLISKFKISFCFAPMFFPIATQVFLQVCFCRLF